MHFDGFKGVFGAGGSEATTVSYKWTDTELVESD